MEPHITLLPLGIDDLAGCSIGHHARTREEVDAMLARAVQVSATIPSPARKTRWSGYIGSFADPGGHVREIAWNPHVWVE